MKHSVETPNYTNIESFESEKNIIKIFTHLQELGVETISPQNIISCIDLLNTINQITPDRINLIKQKLPNINLEMLPIEVLFDKILGIDYIIQYESCMYPCDVTTGKSSVIKNKRTKMQELTPIYESIGIHGTPLIIKSLSQVYDTQTSIDFLVQLEEFLTLKEAVLSNYPLTDTSNVIPPKLQFNISSCVIRI